MSLEFDFASIVLLIVGFLLGHYIALFLRPPQGIAAP
jgi:hypothetical protein